MLPFLTMSMTVEEIKKKLADWIDETTILEILEINSHDLVEAFEDRIIEKQDYLREELEDDGDYD